MSLKNYLSSARTAVPTWLAAKLLRQRHMLDLARHIVHSRKGLVTIYDDEERAKTLEMVWGMEMKVTSDEAIMLVEAVKATHKVEGDIAEVGVFEGATAKLIALAKEPTRRLHLFDTFEGLPQLSAVDTVQVRPGMFCGSHQNVAALFANDDSVSLHKGYFPDETGHAVDSRRFSFVHLDVDLYESTRKALEFFYPRMSGGGIIISHDYNSLPGVRKAFDEFFVGKMEPVIKVASSQCLVVVGHRPHQPPADG